MKIKHLALALFALCLLSVAASAQAVIEFPKGSGTATREAAINKQVTAWDYQLKARPGQVVTIKLESQGRGAVFGLYYEGEGDHPLVLANNATTWTGKLPPTGLEDRNGYATYDLPVSPRSRRPRSEVRFKLTVTVR